jgi:CHASE3 domain sensor protein
MMEFAPITPIDTNAFLKMLVTMVRVTMLIVASFSLVGFLVYLAGIAWFWNEEVRRRAQRREAPTRPLPAPRTAGILSATARRSA